MQAAHAGEADSLACVELDVDELGHRPDALGDLLGRRLQAIIVHGVYAPDVMPAVIDALRAGIEGVPVFRPHTIHAGAVYGWPLVACDAALGKYLDDAEHFDRACASLFGAAQRPAVRIAEIMARLSGRRPVSLPQASDGRPYCAATVRLLGEGDSLPFHYENESFHAPALHEIAPRLDHTTLMSFYVPMAHARDGGELRLYPLDCFDGRESMVGRLGGNELARPNFERAGYTVLRPAVGDLLLFDGGRFYHEVTTVAGERWTMGGVFAFTADRAAVHFWG